VNIQVKPSGSALGAEIIGADLSQPLKIDGAASSKS
jgi:hypothetical protein